VSHENLENSYLCVLAPFFSRYASSVSDRTVFGGEALSAGSVECINGRVGKASSFILNDLRLIGGIRRAER